MPRNVRNFWIDGRIDGRSADLSGGPQSKDGGFSLTIYQRNKGEVMEALRINGRVLSDGSLKLEAETTDGASAIVVRTER